MLIITKRLFVDMDGVIAQFYRVPYYAEKMFEPGFFRELKPYKRVILGLKKFQKKHPEIEINILSACCSKYSYQDKQEWLDEFFPIAKENRILIDVGENKAEHVPGGITENDYLLDDYTLNCRQWADASGTAIKLKNELNCKRGSWTGTIIHYHESSDRFVEHLEKILGIE